MSAGIRDHHHSGLRGFGRGGGCATTRSQVYRNWLGLMNGSLEARVEKGRKPVLRRLNPDRRYRTAGGEDLVLPGRSLMLVRNVGHHMMSDAVTLDGKPVPETFIDAAVTALIALHDLRGPGSRRNSRTGSVYIVKPKMHGPEEAAFADELFAAIENLLRSGPKHPEDRHHGRGTAHQRQSGGMHPCRAPSCGVHQYRVPGSHGR